MPRFVTIGGVVKNIAEWCREYKIQQPTVSHRISAGWDPVRAITTPARKWHKPVPKVIGNIRRGMWEDMVQRCHRPAHKSYNRYGGRGIEVCAAWRESFGSFAAELIAEIGPRPDGYQIDRIDNDRGYEPGNVRWATPKENGNNRSNNIRITHNGETLTASQWADRVGGLTAQQIAQRTRLGWSAADAITKQAREHPTGPQIARRIVLGWSAADAVTKQTQEPAVELEIDGEKMPIAEWAKRAGRNKSTIRNRLRAGMSPHEAVFGELLRRFDGLCPRCKERPCVVDNSLCAPCRLAYKAEWRAKKKKAEGSTYTAECTAYKAKWRAKREAEGHSDTAYKAAWRAKKKAEGHRVT